jgi:hypothetical protein
MQSIAQKVGGNVIFSSLGPVLSFSFTPFARLASRSLGGTIGSTAMFSTLSNSTDSSVATAPESSLRAFANSPRSAIFENIYDTIGQTPIIKLKHMSPKKGVNVYVKLESENPGGSVKDRLAMGVIEWAEKNGQLKPGQTIVEASSGNTGIGLAMVCANKGYPLVCVMAESFSIERRKLMRFLGAQVVLTDPAHKATGMVIKAKGTWGCTNGRELRVSWCSVENSHFFPLYAHSRACGQAWVVLAKSI